MRRSSLADLAALACIVSLAGCGAAGDSPGADNPGGAIIVTPTNAGGLHGAVLAEPYRVPPLTLTDTAGQPFHLAKDTEHPLTLVFFGYTNCPDVCSLVLADIAAALARSDPAVRSQTQVLFVTTDPKRDSPQAMASYLERFDATFTGLTATMSRIKATATALGVPLEGREPLPGGGYEVGHGAQVVGVGPGERAWVVWTEGTPVTDLAEDIATLVRRNA
jgi:protein SCO1/2